MKSSLAALAALASVATAAVAHHSRSEFTDNDLEVEGRLLDVQWRNPHPLFSLAVVNDAGVEETWRLEAYGNALTLQRTGIDPKIFRVGDTVRVAGKTSGRRDHVLLANHILLPNGTEAVLEYEAEPYFSKASVGGAASWVVDEEVLRRAAVENRGLFRVWSLPMRGLDMEYTPLRPEAIAAREGWDPLNNYLTQCIAGGMPHSMRNPQRYELIEGDGEIYVRAQFFNMERTIHIENAQDPETQPPSKYGYSVGRWENPRTLVVDTTRINWPWFDTSGTPQSEDMRIFERYTLSEDQSRLDFHMEMTDPSILTETATFDKYWLALGGELLHYECIVE